MGEQQAQAFQVRPEFPGIALRQRRQVGFAARSGVILFLAKSHVVYGVSRKTGYKWVERYEAEGIDGLRDQSRAADYHPNEVLKEVGDEGLKMRRRHPHWGPPNLGVRLQWEAPEIIWPAASTIGEMLKRDHERWIQPFLAAVPSHGGNRRTKRARRDGGGVSRVWIAGGDAHRQWRTV